MIKHLIKMPPQSHFLSSCVAQDGCTPLLDGPYLHLAMVPQWGPACVVAHRKASDEHIRIVQLGEASGGAAGGMGADEEALWPCEVMVTEDSTRIALPSAPGGDENFVVGLAVDTSCDVVRWGVTWCGGVCRQHDPASTCSYWMQASRKRL